MQNTFVIAWRSKAEPRSDQSKKLFPCEETQAPADELNENYPAFHDQPSNLSMPDRELARREVVLI